MAKLSLIQRFCLLCFASLVVFGIAFGWLGSNAFEQSTIERARKETAEIVLQHVTALFSEEDFLRPKTGDEYAEFSLKATAIPLGTNIKKLTFWNRDRVVVWSHDRELVGQAFNENAALSRALGGEVAAELATESELAEKYHGNGSTPGEEVLELYVPVTYGDPHAVPGVVEVYEDEGPLLASIARHNRFLWLILVSGFSLLFLVLYGIVSKASGKIEAQSGELRDLVIGLTGSFAHALDAKSPWTKGHSERVGMYSERIALKMGLPKSEIENLKLAGLLHDIGKIGTYDYLLEKPEKLTEEEFELVKKHPELGAKILSEIRQLQDIVPVIEHHHERYDGGGYPQGIKGKDIPIGARILHVADSFEAITDHRPYRSARDYGAAIRELIRNSGTQFDPDVVEAFIEVMEEIHGLGVEKNFGKTNSPDKGSLPENSVEDISDVS
jgi:putative nucleotidyltransferase with HDIG domain